MLEKRGFVSFRELDKRLTASPATVRRDLERLAMAGRIVRVHGGAKMPDAVMTGLSGVPFHENIKKNAAAKAAIGKAAAELCRPGESIIIDGGSTTLQMCPHLEGLGLQVVTNSLHIVSALFPQPKTRVYLPAGALFREQNIVLSPFDDDGTGHYQASKIFIGAASVGPRRIDANGCDFVAGGAATDGAGERGGAAGGQQQVPSAGRAVGVRARGDLDAHHG